MKSLLSYLFTLCFLLAIVSCEEEDNVTPIGGWELTGAGITSPEDHADIILDAENPGSEVVFNWNAGSNDQGYLVTYTVLIDEEGGDFSDPLLSLPAANDGTDLSASVSHLALDQMLADLGLQVSESADLQWAVQTKALSKTELDTRSIRLTRFETETVPDALYLAGSATEAGNNPAGGIAMMELLTADGTPTNVFEVYTSLTEGETFNFYAAQDADARFFGGNSGQLLNAGDPIVAPETGQYRIRADFNISTYAFKKIDYWSLVGNVIDGGWGGDVPLQYQGNGVWSGVVNLTDADPGDANKRFIFRANGDWGVLLKLVTGTDDQLVLESFANDNGYSFEDIPVQELGRKLITLDLSGPTPTYTIEEDNSAPAEAPASLYLFADGTLVTELNKNGDVFTYGFLDMKPGMAYTLRENQDGSGRTYSLRNAIGQPGAEGDHIMGSAGISTSQAAFEVSENQAYGLSLDFSNGVLNWDYYNFKLFHWSDWDTRAEIRMTYQGDYTWTVTEALTAGNNSKFISPWDYDFGSESPGALSGTMVTGGGENFLNINEDGTYQVTIVLQPDFTTGSYEFVKQ